MPVLICVHVTMEGFEYCDPGVPHSKLVLDDAWRVEEKEGMNRRISCPAWDARFRSLIEISQRCILMKSGNKS